MGGMGSENESDDEVDKMKVDNKQTIAFFKINFKTSASLHMPVNVQLLDPQ